MPSFLSCLRYPQLLSYLQREAGKGDDPCVTFISPCEICTIFTEEQLTKITHRKRYVKKPDKKADRNDQELDLLGDNSVESFVGSQADLESAADNLFTSPSCLRGFVTENARENCPANSRYCFTTKIRNQA